MKKLMYIVILYISVASQQVFGGQGDRIPDINCVGLPGCDDSSPDVIDTISSTIISELIKYVAVFAVIALMISGVMYMLSSGDEEKTKKARTWIIYSVIAVLLSMSAYFIVDFINNIDINS